MMSSVYQISESLQAISLRRLVTHAIGEELSSEQGSSNNAMSERTELIARVWKDERAQATLWSRDDEYREEFTAEVNKRGLNIARYIYNALDDFAIGTPADVAVQGWLQKMPATEKKKFSRAEGVARVADILKTNPDISHGQLAQELGVPVGTVREWRKEAEKEYGQ
jgi:hypothetical protein